MKKIIITIFVIAFVSLVQSPSWAGFGDNTTPFSNEENSKEQIDESSVDEQGNTTNFETDDNDDNAGEQAGDASTAPDETRDKEAEA